MGRLFCSEVCSYHSEGGVIDDFNSEDEYDSGDVLLSGQEGEHACVVCACVWMCACVLWYAH